MDVFIEKIVAKKLKPLDYLLIGTVAFLGIILFLFVAILSGNQAVGPFSLFFLVAIIYGVYHLITSRNIEFEYIVTNADLDIDRIISRRRRKRIFSASCKEFEVMAKTSSDKYNAGAAGIKNRIEAVSSMKAPDVYFAILHYKGERTIVFFQPDERMLNSFKAFIPKKLFM